MAIVFLAMGLIFWANHRIERWQWLFVGVVAAVVVAYATMSGRLLLAHRRREDGGL